MKNPLIESTIRPDVPYYECAFGIALRRKIHKCTHPEKSTTSLLEDLADCENPCPLGFLIPQIEFMK